MSGENSLDETPKVGSGKCLGEILQVGGENSGRNSDTFELNSECNS